MKKLTIEYQKMIVRLAEQGAEFYNALKEAETKLIQLEKENQELRFQLARAIGKKSLKKNKLG